MSDANIKWSDRLEAKLKPIDVDQLRNDVRAVAALAFGEAIPERVQQFIDCEFGPMWCLFEIDRTIESSGQAAHKFLAGLTKLGYECRYAYHRDSFVGYEAKLYLFDACTDCHDCG